MPGTEGGAEKVEMFFKRYRVSAWEDEKVVEMDGGNGCRAVSVYLMPLNCTLCCCLVTKSCLSLFQAHGL